MKKTICSLLGSVLVIPLMVGCPDRGRVYVRTYGPAESPYYSQWEGERHYQHMEYERRKQREQGEYWKWRNQHRDHDRGHDRDRDRDRDHDHDHN
jgi:hypothetical protein